MNERAIFQNGSPLQRYELLQKMIDETRVKNDAVLSMEETALLRGELRALKRLQDLLSMVTPQVDEEPAY